MKPQTKLFTILSLVVLVTLVFAPAALAFDGRSADRVVIGKDEVINDDLYLTGREVIVEGTINGDLMAAGETVVVNGTVTGDVWAAGSSVTIDGTVGDDLFAAAAVVTIGRQAKISDDVFTAAASVESKAGSQIGGTFLIGASQGLVSGQTAEDLLAGTSRLRIEGQVDGSAKIAVDSEGSFSPNPMMFNPNMPAMPSVPGGLTFGDAARVEGTLEYTSATAFSIPAGVSAQVNHLLPPVDEQVAREINRENSAGSLVLDAIRRLFALLIIGLLIARLLPAWILGTAGKLQARPLPSLGIGLLGIILTPFILLAALTAIILIAILLGALTLGQLVGVVVGIGLPGLVLVGALYFMLLGFLPQAVIAYLGGRWILERTNSTAAQNRYWALLLGTLILAILIALPAVGGLIEFLVVIAGSGAIILLLWERRRKPAAIVAEA